MYSIKIDFKVQGKELELPEDLNCEKYADPLSVKDRKKRSTFETGLVMSDVLLCDYKVDLESKKSETFKEELFWQNLTRNLVIENVFCEDGYTDNCILRKLHMLNATFTWKKRYDYTEDKFKIEVSAEVYRVPRKIPVVKEIMYRTVPIVRQAKEGKPIEIAYHCLGNPYEGENKLLFDQFVFELQKQRPNLLLTNMDMPMIVFILPIRFL